MTGASDANHDPPGMTSLLIEGAGRWVVDPTASRVEFHVKHFWHLITVHGLFDRVDGEGTITPDGAVSGRLTIDATSLNTKNGKRDAHLRSADFFDVEHHPQVMVTVSSAEPAGAHTLACQGTLQAAAHTKPVEFSAHIEDATSEAATVRAELVVDRSEFNMTWSPLKMASMQARATVVARFVRR